MFSYLSGGKRPLTPRMRGFSCGSRHGRMVRHDLMFGSKWVIGEKLIDSNAFVKLIFNFCRQNMVINSGRQIDLRVKADQMGSGRRVVKWVVSGGS